MNAIVIITINAVLFFSVVPGVFAESHIGIILDGYQNDCRIQRGNKIIPCEGQGLLYKGDKILKQPDTRSLKIKWAPFAGAKQLDNATLLAAFEPPENKQSVLQSLKELIGFVKTRHTVTMGVTRGMPSGAGISQPGNIGNIATVLPGEKITFALESNGDHIVFKDQSGKEVFQRDLRGASTVQLTPEEIGIKPDYTYTWSISGPKESKQYYIRLLNSENSQMIGAALKEIDREEMDESMKHIKKAVYLQFMSNAYPGDIDLYWLSFQILEECREKGFAREDNEFLIQELVNNYRRRVEGSY
jgi:hypothetical protein